MHREDRSAFSPVIFFQCIRVTKCIIWMMDSIYYNALKFNVIQDKESEANRSAREKPVKIREEPIPIPPRKQSTRKRRQKTMLRDYELRAEALQEPRPPRISLKIPKKIWNQAANRNIAIPEPEPEPEPEHPNLSLKIPNDIWNEAADRNIAIPELEPPKLSLNFQKNTERRSQYKYRHT